ncbi:MAG: TAXI family TRAP transporter solute-binding subunit [Desulfurococcaceae archaeon TW002]
MKPETKPMKIRKSIEAALPTRKTLNTSKRLKELERFIRSCDEIICEGIIGASRLNAMKGVSRTLIAVAGVVIVVLAIVLAYYALTPPTPYKITIYTGGIYYPLGVKLADLLNNYTGNKITASASSSGASVANARALEAGRRKPNIHTERHSLLRVQRTLHVF